MLFSVVIPAFDEEAYLGRGSTVIIVVENDSADSTAAVAALPCGG
jgi:glycosyltransferase involved in cell wall biosynthesis